MNWQVPAVLEGGPLEGFGRIIVMADEANETHGIAASWDSPPGRQGWAVRPEQSLGSRSIGGRSQCVGERPGIPPGNAGSSRTGPPASTRKYGPGGWPGPYFIERTCLAL